ncbi:MAG: cobalt-precorrin-5B (C(1))-methyltransferase CbiD [Eubacteriales bacterium]|nr:cobalt-precorrin-5B (C(1))-methyltransferase CbiD [Eubacteriales bacterium]
MEWTKRYQGKELRYGFTTGSSATAAAKRAASQLLLGQSEDEVEITTPQGQVLTIPTRLVFAEPDHAKAKVVKDAGDDPDITDGIEIFADVSRIPQGLEITGGEGVGTVTKPGLDQPVGEKAINSGPRYMLTQALSSVCEAAGYQGGLRIVISIPAGTELARKTFNPKLGIVGGISVIGTTGIVEPMSSKALFDTIVLEIRQAATRQQDFLMLISGNYSKDFLRVQMQLDNIPYVVTSNFVRDSLEAAWKEGFQQVLLVGHIGKYVKLALGMPNTHSDYGDGRMPCLVYCALKAGADRDVLLAISNSVTTEAALYILREHDLLWTTMEILGQIIEEQLTRHLPEGKRLGFIFFCNKKGLPGELYRSEEAKKMLAELPALEGN